MKTFTFILVATAIIASSVNEAKAHSISTGTPAGEPAKDKYSVAVKKFNAAHPLAENVTWTTTPDDYTAVYRTNGVTNIWVYYRATNLSYNIRRYDASGLNPVVKSRIANAFAEYSVTSVDEVHVQDYVAYLVRMESGKYRKLLRVDDNEMTVIKSEAK